MGLAMWKAVVISVGLGAAAQPIHEVGHAIAVRLFTGAWPRFTLLAVFPPAIPSQEAALGILVAGDIAVLLWCAVIFACTRRRPVWKLALIGPSFMTAIAMASWFVAAALTPFGLASVGASDAAKFLAVSGVNPLWVVVSVSVMGIAMAACARHAMKA
jgi:hypothetical protein